MCPKDRIKGCTQNRHKENLKNFFLEKWFQLNFILKIVSMVVHRKGIENKT